MGPHRATVFIGLVAAGASFCLAWRIRRPVTAGITLVVLFALSFLPIYGSGENLASGGKLNRNAYQAYGEAFSDVLGRK